ncbi:MAG: lactate utilization protein [Desulfuromonadales bacterium]|nr:lactate utilization protein [Desulfuromonadales bacterium]
MNKHSAEQFTHAAQNVGATVLPLPDMDAAVSYIKQHVDGPVLLPPSPSLARTSIAAALKDSGLSVIEEDFRSHGANANAGITSANFAFADTGTLVLESTEEAVRIATTLPEKHFVILDPAKILPCADEAAPLLQQLHHNMPQLYLAYITGPSRTADIERVLTIGVHGPAQLHILLLEGLSDDPLER